MVALILHLLAIAMAIGSGCGDSRRGNDISPARHFASKADRFELFELGTYCISSLMRPAAQGAYANVSVACSGNAPSLYSKSSIAQSH